MRPLSSKHFSQNLGASTRISVITSASLWPVILKVHSSVTPIRSFISGAQLFLVVEAKHTIIQLYNVIHIVVVSCCVSRTSRQHRRDPWWHWEFVCFREASCSGGTQRRWQDCGDGRLAVKGFVLTLSSACDWIMYRIFFKSFATFFPRKKHQHCGNGIADADTMAGVQRCQLPQGTLMLSSLAVLVLGWDRTTKITKSCKNHRWKDWKDWKDGSGRQAASLRVKESCIWDWHKCLRRWSTWKRRWMLVPLSSSHRCSLMLKSFLTSFRTGFPD